MIIILRFIIEICKSSQQESGEPHIYTLFMPVILQGFCQVILEILRYTRFVWRPQDEKYFLSQQKTLSR